MSLERSEYSGGSPPAKAIFSKPAVFVDGGVVAGEALEDLFRGLVPDKGLGVVLPGLGPGGDVGGQSRRTSPIERIWCTIEVEQRLQQSPVELLPRHPYRAAWTC